VRRVVVAVDFVEWDGGRSGRHAREDVLGAAQLMTNPNLNGGLTRRRLQEGQCTCSADARARAAAHIMSTREGWRSFDSTTTTKMLRGRRNRFMTYVTCDV
jgi:hypothetical protein